MTPQQAANLLTPIIALLSRISDQWTDDLGHGYPLPLSFDEFIALLIDWKEALQEEPRP